MAQCPGVLKLRHVDRQRKKTGLYTFDPFTLCSKVKKVKVSL
jgi:hypothetical protein